MCEGFAAIFKSNIISPLDKYLHSSHVKKIHSAASKTIKILIWQCMNIQELVLLIRFRCRRDFLGKVLWVLLTLIRSVT